MTMTMASYVDLTLFVIFGLVAIFVGIKIYGYLKRKEKGNKNEKD